jgi:polar amino acid transport system substrate-binding protein
MKNIFILATALILSFNACAMELTFAYDEWAPFAGKKILNNGLSTDIVKTLLEKKGHQVKLRSLPFARILVELKNGKIDGACDLWKTEEREVYAYYSEPYYINSLVFVTMADRNITISSLEDLNALTGSMLIGQAFVKVVKDNAKSLQTVKAIDNSVKKVYLKRVDFTMGDKAVLEYSINQIYSDQSKKNKFKFQNFAMKQNGLYFVMSKAFQDHKKVIADFNSQLTTSMQNGDLDKIFNTHGISNTLNSN